MDLTKYLHFRKFPPIKRFSCFDFPSRPYDNVLRFTFWSMSKQEQELDLEKHVQYIVSLEHKTKISDALYFTDHKRLSGVYWAISSLRLLNRLEVLQKERILEYTLSCYHPEVGGFSGNTDQDVHLLYTLSGIQILAIYDALDRVEGEMVVKTVQELQQPDGSFCGDKWGEVDTRFTYCALLTLSILNRMDAVDVTKAVEYILECQNFDGGFGCIRGAESHAGQVFCCVGALSLAGVLSNLDKDASERLAFWLCERQLPCGGFNGRPDKLEDVCYSWWVLASLAMLNHIDFIDGSGLTAFIVRCQDPVDGGFADRPGDMPDVFHTFFGLAGLSLLGDSRLSSIDPTYALPTDVVRKLK